VPGTKRNSVRQMQGGGELAEDTAHMVVI
jgi:hypothetical protein